MGILMVNVINMKLALVVSFLVAGVFGDNPYAPPAPYHPAPYAPPKPVYHPEPHYEEKAPPKPYVYEYGGVDYNGQAFQKAETQDEYGTVQGEYRVELPDGRTQIVTYHADHENGFVADVKYEGVAKPYEPAPYKPPHKPVHLAPAPYHPEPAYAPAPYAN